MQIKDFYYDSSDHKHLAYAKYWIPEQKPIGILQFIHGIFEHVGRYDEAAEYFTSQGFVCSANDLLGHGRTAAGRPGFFGYNHGIKHLLADIERLRVKTKEAFPNLPYFILGFSMGSYLERLLISEPHIAYELSGAVIAGTMGPNPKIAKALEVAQNTVNQEGPKGISKELHKIAFEEFEQAFPNETEEYSWVTSIKGRRENYKQDSQSQFSFTNAGFRDFFNIINRCNRESVISSTDSRLPLLFISGKDDPVGNFGKGVRKIANKYIDNGMDDVTLRIYPHVRHDVLFDFPATQNRSLPFIKNWLTARI